MNSLIGIVLYFVLLSALTNDAELFDFMVVEAGSDETRMRLVLSAQVLSAPSDHHPERRQRLYAALKSFLLRSVLLMPIVTGGLWILFDLQFFDIEGIKEDFKLYPWFL